MDEQIDRIALGSLLLKIADKHLSEADRNTFSMTGDALVEDALKGTYTKESSSITDTEAFGAGDLKIGIEIVSVVTGTIKTIFEIYKLYGKRPTKVQSQEIATQWKRKLMESGIGGDKAESIVADFLKELLAII